MNPRRHCLLPLLFAATAAAVPSQQPSAATTLHEAWLHEVLDLDVARAVAGYQQVAADASPGHLERWVAAARLLELRRLHATTVAPPDLADAPPALRAAFATTAAELPVAELLARVREEPQTVLQKVGTDAGRLPPLRTAVPACEDWLMSQIGPSLRDRWRQRMAAFSSRARGSEAANATERIYAADIVRAELQGRTTQADALRTLYFADWRPPAATGDPVPLLAQVRERLAAMLAEPTLQAPQATLLRELGEAIDQRAATSPAAALAFVLRLPIYSERLLPTAATGR